MNNPKTSFPPIFLNKDDFLNNIYSDLKIQENIHFYEENSDINFNTENTFFLVIIEIVVQVLFQPFKFKKMIDLCSKIISKNIFDEEFKIYLILYSLKLCPNLVIELLKKKILTLDEINISFELLISNGMVFNIKNIYDEGLDDLLSRDFIIQKDSLEYLIKFDEIELFINKINMLNIDLNSKIFISNTLFQEEMSLIEISAFYGSLKIFKYLILNKVYISKAVHLLVLLSGNIDLIYFFDLNPQNYREFNNYILIPLETRNYDIFLWIFQNSLFQEHLSSLNFFSLGIWTFLYYYQLNYDIKKFSLLSLFCIGSINLIDFLLDNYFDINSLICNQNVDLFGLDLRFLADYNPLLTFSIQLAPFYFNEYLILKDDFIYNYNSNGRRC